MYLKLTKSKSQNFRNVQKAMRIVDIFHRWSGLKVNRGKTYSTIFGICLKQPEYVAQLGLKWCIKFELLGIQFDQTLSDMECNYENYESDEGCVELMEI